MKSRNPFAATFGALLICVSVFAQEDESSELLPIAESDSATPEDSASSGPGMASAADAASSAEPLPQAQRDPDAELRAMAEALMAAYLDGRIIPVLQVPNGRRLFLIPPRAAPARPNAPIDTRAGDVLEPKSGSGNPLSF